MINFTEQEIKDKELEIAKFSYLRDKVKRQVGYFNSALTTHICYGCSTDNNCSNCEDKKRSDKWLREKALDRLLREYIHSKLNNCSQCNSSDIFIYESSSEFYIGCGDCNTKSVEFKKSLEDSYEDLINAWNSQIFRHKTSVVDYKELTEELKCIVHLCSSDINHENINRSRRLCRVNMKYKNVWHEHDYPYSYSEENVAKLINYFSSLGIKEDENFLIKMY